MSDNICSCNKILDVNCKESIIGVINAKLHADGDDENLTYTILNGRSLMLTLHEKYKEHSFGAICITSIGKPDDYINGTWIDRGENTGLGIYYILPLNSICSSDVINFLILSYVIGEQNYINVIIIDPFEKTINRYDPNFTNYNDDHCILDDYLEKIFDHLKMPYIRNLKNEASIQSTMLNDGIFNRFNQEFCAYYTIRRLELMSHNESIDELLNIYKKCGIGGIIREIAKIWAYFHNHAKQLPQIE